SLLFPYTTLFRSSLTNSLLKHYTVSPFVPMFPCLDLYNLFHNLIIPHSIIVTFQPLQFVIISLPHAFFLIYFLNSCLKTPLIVLLYLFVGCRRASTPP